MRKKVTNENERKKRGISLFRLLVIFHLLSSNQTSVTDGRAIVFFIIHLSCWYITFFLSQVCRICNATGHNCGVKPGSVPGHGIDGADFVFYVSAMQTERCYKGLTVAYASHCQQEAALDR